MSQTEDNSSDDLLTKYQRLATKYSKMRAQLTVLKTAFTEEQTKSNELKDSIKERDQSIRKLEQEMESLDFRNQQLTKRVGILQEELASAQNNSKKSSKTKQLSNQSTPQHNHNPNSATNGGFDVSVLDVINTELQNKITENERLHIQLNSIEMDYIHKISDIQRQLDQTKSDNQFKNKSIVESLETKQQIIDALNEEKNGLENKFKSQLKQLEDSKLLAQNLEIENKSLKIRIQSLEQLIENNAETRDSLLKQLSICESKLSSAEQGKEHWMLECQLIQVKLDNQLKRSQDLETRLQANEGVAQQTQTSIQTSSSTPSGSQRSIEMSCNDFAGSSLQSPTVSEDKISLNSHNGVEEEIPQVTAYLRNRISQLIDNLHVSDSKAVAFHTECVSLQQRLSVSEKQKKQILEDIDKKYLMISHLKEELATNVSNYESQLSLMSEHLANMNDKLTQQTDEIDSLKHNNSIKGKKSKNK